MRIDADVGDTHPAAIHPARQQKMRGLLAEEGDGFGRLHGRAHHRARRAVDAARQIDRQHRRTVGVDGRDHLQRVALHRAIEAGAEQRVDDQRRLADRLRIERQHRIFPALRRQRRIALQAVALAEQDHRDLAAARGELGGGDKAVAAIVAAAGDHDDRPLLDQVHRGFSNRLASAHHQREARRAGCDRQPIGALHLGGGQNVHAESSIASPFREAIPVTFAEFVLVDCIEIDLFAYLLGLDIIAYLVRYQPTAC